MRIAVVNGSRRKTGGVESYLQQLIPALVARGNKVACLFELDADGTEGAIQIPDSVPIWISEGTNRDGALAALQAWEPSVVFLHSPIATELKDCLLKMAPGVFFAHNYYGTCISGIKRHAFPQVRPCEKVFSPACLVHYFPRRCGGLNPVTMLTRYRSESAWLKGLRDFAAIVVASKHMAAEYQRHGFPDRVHVVGLPVSGPANAPTSRSLQDGTEPLRLLFVGRMESYKGGLMLLDSLPEVAHSLHRPIHIIFAGDGRRRVRWESHAGTITQKNLGIEVKFPGWLSGENIKKVMEISHLLVLPSLWPEPFGLVGLEAGAYGLPTAAFDVGGIADWLKEGVNGHLAPGNPPTALGFAEAICRCVADPAGYAALSTGAAKRFDHFTIARHLEKLAIALAQASSAGPLRLTATRTC